MKRRPTRFLLLTLLVGALIAVPGLSRAQAAGGARPVVLLVHGRGLAGADTMRLREAWREALGRGILAAEGDLALGEDDLRLVWYADALDPRAGGTCPGDEREAAPAAELGTALAAAGSLMAAAAEWVGGPEGDALRSISGDLLYLGDAGRRCAAEDRLADALARAAAEGRPVVLVAHSFGSLLAYRHLHARADDGAPPVERLVTIGSLVGRPELRALLLGGSGGQPKLPAGVGSWVNVRDPKDPLAAALAVPAGETSIVDVETELLPAGDPHDPGRYLADPATARAVLEAWTAAHPAGR